MPPPTPPPMPWDEMVAFQAKTQAAMFNDVLISIAAESNENLNMSYDELKALTKSRIDRAVIHEREMWAKPVKQTFSIVDKSQHEANKAQRAANAEIKRKEFYKGLNGFFGQVFDAFTSKPKKMENITDVKYWHDDPLAETLKAEQKQKELVKA